MSSISFQESAVSVSALKLSECTPPHFANAIHTLRRCSESIGQTLRSIQTFETSTPANTQEQLTLFAEDTPASRSRKPVSAKARMTIVTPGRRCLELYEVSDRDGSL